MYFCGKKNFLWQKKFCGKKSFFMTKKVERYIIRRVPLRWIQWYHDHLCILILNEFMATIIVAFLTLWRVIARDWRVSGQKFLRISSQQVVRNHFLSHSCHSELVSETVVMPTRSWGYMGVLVVKIYKCIFVYKLHLYDFAFHLCKNPGTVTGQSGYAFMPPTARLFSRSGCIKKTAPKCEYLNIRFRKTSFTQHKKFASKNCKTQQQVCFTIPPK